MDYRRTYDEFRNGMIDKIINNADAINSKLDARILGYCICEELDECIKLDNGCTALRAYHDPIFIIRIRDCTVIGYSAIDANRSCDIEFFYYLKELSTETLINLCEIIE